MKIFPRVFSALVICGAAVLVDLSAAAADRPNIVFVFTDDHSLQTIGAYGSRLSAFCKEHNCGRGHGVPGRYGLRTPRHTLARFSETDEWELFDLEKDPQQLKSVYADGAYAETVTELNSKLTRLRTKFKDSTDQDPLPGRKRRNSKEKS